MAQTINIVDLDINIDELLKKAQESKKSILELSKEIKSLKDTQSESSKNIEQYTQDLAILENTGRGTSKQAQALRDHIEINRQKFEQSTRTLVEHEAKIKTMQGEYRSYSKVIQAYSDKMERSREAIAQHDGSLNQISAALSHNKQLYKELTKEERENSEIGGRLLKLIQEQDKEYKELHKSMGNMQVEVGNYKEEVKKAINESFNLQQATTALLGPFGSLSPLLVTSFNSLKAWSVGSRTATTSNTLLSKSLTILRGAFIATGIGAIVVLLGSLIAYLTSTQEGVNKVTRVLTPLKEIFATLWGVMQDVGKALLKVFSNTSVIKDFGNVIKNVVLFPINQVIASVKALGKVLEGDLGGAWDEFSEPVKESFDSVKNLAKSGVEAGKQIAGAFDGFGDKMKDAWERGKKIADLEQELREFNIDYKRQTSELNRMYKEQQQILEDTTKSESERRQAGLKAIELQNQINALAEKRNGLEVDLITLKQQANDTDDAGKKELQDKLAELEEEKAERIKKTTTIQNKLNSINKEALQKRKEQLQKSLEEEKKLIDDYLASGSGVAKSLDERLKLEEKAKDDRLAVLEKERKAGLISINDYNREKLETEQNYLRTRAELVTENLSYEVNLYEQLNTSKIDSETQLTAELVAEEQTRLDTIYQMKVDALEKEKELRIKAKDWDYRKEQSFNEAKLQLETEHNENKKTLHQDLENALSEEKKAMKALELQSQIQQLEEENAYVQEIQKVQLQAKFEQEMEALDEQHAKGLISTDLYLKSVAVKEKEHKKNMQELDEALFDAKMENLSAVLGNAKGIFEEHTAMSKAMAVAEAMINTYLGATKAIATYPPPFGTIMAGVAIATGMANVQKIMSVKSGKKAKRGITLKGRSHEAGGIDLYDQYGNHVVEAEGDENIYVLNKRASKEITALSMLNQKTGGVPLTTHTHFARSGGLVGRAITQSSNVDFDFNPTEFAEIVAPILAEGVKLGAGAGTFEGASRGTMQGTIQGVAENRKTKNVTPYE
ncbi:hypothetical protein CAPN008_05940 [Capnocytophaga canis]|uniref:hypothetical protein n=1 Tax=Capnocytophaga canis TaxID=1848903 RepID=UPI001AC33425|nr:hypothetical protein [Capnocytophaga canis]GIM60544.1 hypothetical protein CAPN008_05940 [Capnocytophaga canis]